MVNLNCDSFNVLPDWFVCQYLLPDWLRYRNWGAFGEAETETHSEIISIGEHLRSCSRFDIAPAPKCFLQCVRLVHAKNYGKFERFSISLPEFSIFWTSLSEQFCTIRTFWNSFFFFFEIWMVNWFANRPQRCYVSIPNRYYMFLCNYITWEC